MRAPVPGGEPRSVATVGQLDGPLAAVLPGLCDTLVAIAVETMHRLIVTDALGHVLWDDARTGHPVRARHGWTAAACPIHEPGSGSVVGIVDVVGRRHPLHPTTFALVAAAARLAEGHLGARLALLAVTAR